MIAASRGVDVRAIPEHLINVAAWGQLWSATAFHVREGLVAVTEAARNKFETSAFGALTFRGGPRPENDPTVPAWMYGIVIGLDESSARVPIPNKLNVAV